MKQSFIALSVFLLFLAGCGDREPPEVETTELDPKAVEAIILGCWDGNLREVKAALEAHPALLNVEDKDGWTPLLAAAEAWEFDVVKHLVEKGADVRVTYAGTKVWPMIDLPEGVDKSKVKLVPHGDPTLTPLHYAAAGGRVDVVKMMLDAGADPHARDRDGDTPMIWAAGKAGEGALETVKLLHSRGPTPERVDAAIFAAALGNNKDVVAFLRAKRDDVLTPYAFWKHAQGIHPDRMNVKKGAYLISTVYVSLWKRGEDEYLVCIRYPGHELFGTPYHVYVFDKEMKLVKEGATTMQQDCFPYALVEVMSDSESLPEALRGKWLLGIANLWWREEWETCEPALDMKKARVLVAWDSPDDDKANYIGTDLVDWAGDGVEMTSTQTNRLESYRLRWPETGPNVFHRMLQDYHD